MNKSSKFIWLNSFAADEELPKCPEDISEPAWAQLLYNPFCQVRYAVPPVTTRNQVSDVASGCSIVIHRGPRTSTGFHTAGFAKNAFRKCGYSSRAENVDSHSYMIF